FFTQGNPPPLVSRETSVSRLVRLPHFIPDSPCHHCPPRAILMRLGTRHRKLLAPAGTRLSSPPPGFSHNLPALSPTTRPFKEHLPDNMHRDTVPSTFLGKVHFVPQVPESLSGIAELSRNLWWTWNPRARELFRMIDLETWITTNGNAVRF